MANVTITTNDPNNRLAAVPLLAATIRAAADYLDRYVVFRGTLDVSVLVETTATGRFQGGGAFVFQGRRDGVDIYEPTMLAESRTGVDPAPDGADFTIYIDPTSAYLSQLWWDPAIGTSLAANPPQDQTDAFTVVLHELMHGMGMIGWRNWEDGSFTGAHQSMWDTLVSVEGTRAYFGGAATTALIGERVEVRLGGTQGIYHLGAGPSVDDSRMPWIERAHMNGYHYYLGERYMLGRLELAMLQDIGWTLEPAATTVTDVVNRWDDRDNTLFVVGWEGTERLDGGAHADRIEGRGGNDMLQGLQGNDHLDGGAGVDSALYTRNRADYTVAATARPNSVTARVGGEGTDTLNAVERLRFADVGIAYDLDGQAGLTARLIGAVFGASHVANRNYVGVGLKCLDDGMTPLQLAQLAIDAGLGAGVSHEALVRTVYQNVVGTAPSMAEVNHYTGLLANGSYTPASLTLFAAEADITAARIDLMGLASTGIEFTPL